MIFLIAAFVPPCIFYIYVLINFQRELWKVNRPKSAASPLIHIRRHGTARHDAPRPHLRHVAVVPSEPKRLESAPSGLVHNWREAELALTHRHSHEVYQLESAYVGPLFLMPLSEESSGHLQSSWRYSMRPARNMPIGIARGAATSASEMNCLSVRSARTPAASPVNPCALQSGSALPGLIKFLSLAYLSLMRWEYFRVKPPRVTPRPAIRVGVK